ncbi:hypothetical protein D3C81_483430 [compost metagenome]
MLQIKPIASALQFALDYGQVQFADRSKVTSLLVADALSTQLPLPTSAVDSPEAWYRNTIRMNLGRALNVINEQHVIDMDIVEDLVFKLWIARYRLVHEPTHPGVSSLLKNMVLCGDITDPVSVQLAQQYKVVYQNQSVIEAFKENSVF